MPQSLSNIAIHVVFSTLNRRPLIDKAMQPRLHAYLASVTRNLGCECYRAGGIEDHVHLAVRLSRTLPACKLVERVKTASSMWLKKETDLPNFYWQKGYGALSLNPDGIKELCQYIEKQADHHRMFSFVEEYRKLLEANGIEYDERYMWD